MGARNFVRGPCKKRRSADGALGEMLIAGKTGEERERPMLERVQEAPAQAIAWRASGTVMAQDVETAIEAAVGDAATGLVIVIDPDFNGDFGELARGLAGAALAQKSLVKLALVTDLKSDGPGRSRRLRGFARSRPPVRPQRREKRARMGRGGPARGVARPPPAGAP